MKAFLSSLWILNVISTYFNIFQQNISTKYVKHICISEFVKGTKLVASVASLRWTLGPHASGCYGSARMWQRLGTGDLGRAGGIAVIPIFPIFCHLKFILIFLWFSLFSLFFLSFWAFWENYLFLLATLLELIAAKALHARQVWCYFTLNLQTVKLQRRSWNQQRTSSGLSSGVLAAQPVRFEGRRGCKTGKSTVAAHATVNEFANWLWFRNVREALRSN